MFSDLSGKSVPRGRTVRDGCFARNDHSHSVHFARWVLSNFRLPLGNFGDPNMYQNRVNHFVNHGSATDRQNGERPIGKMENSVFRWRHMEFGCEPMVI